MEKKIVLTESQIKELQEAVLLGSKLSMALASLFVPLSQETRQGYAKGLETGVELAFLEINRLLEESINVN